MDKINNIKNTNQLHSIEAVSPKNSDEKILDFLIKTCSKKIMEEAERYVPEYNKFASHSILFEISGTQNIAKITIKHDEEDYKTKRRVLVGVSHQNSDVMYSNYLFTGTKKEVLEYLKTLSDDKSEEFIAFKKAIAELSKESDKFHSSL